MKPILLPTILRRCAALAALALLAACARSKCDDAAPVEPEVGDPPCGVLPPSPSDFGYSYRVDQYPIWQSGCYNPLNKEEAAVVAYEQGDPMTAAGAGTRLYRMNLLTGQKTLLFDGVTSYTVDWHRNGWILFTPLRTLQAWKIKANGDSLTQLTFSSTQVHTVESWSPDGKFFVCRRTSGPYAQTGLAIHTAQGAFVRLLPDATTRADRGVAWSPDGRRLAFFSKLATPTNQPRLALYDLTTNQLETLDNVRLAAQSSTFGLRWLPNGTEVVWAGDDGISVTNVLTGETRQVRIGCVLGGRGQLWPSVSADGQQLLVKRVDYVVSPTNSNLLLERYSLETSNLRGTQIRKVTP